MAWRRFTSAPATGPAPPLGEALAEFIQRELTARTGMLDCGTHPKTWELLRMTQMPAVRVELGYLTNPEDRRKLLEPAFRDVVAEGLVVAVKRLYLLGENDQPTGTFTFADLLRGELAPRRSRRLRQAGRRLGSTLCDRHRRQQPFQGSLDVFLPGQRGAQLQAQPGPARVRVHRLETDLLQELGRDHAGGLRGGTGITEGLDGLDTAPGEVLGDRLHQYPAQAATARTPAAPSTR